MQRKAKIEGKVWNIRMVYCGEGIKKQNVNEVVSKEEENETIIGRD